jgi:thiosulfate dehydrogenase [quinone] large subunit
MNGVTMDRRMVLVFRLLMGWTFLYAGAWQVLSPDFSAAAFLAHTKTFHDVYAPLTSPAIAPVLTFLVSYGHLLIGLSLVSGLLVRVSGVFGVALLLTYWTAHMDFPYIESQVNLFIDYHIVFATLTGWLVAANAGRCCGLDGWVAEWRSTQHRAEAMG